MVTTSEPDWDVICVECGNDLACEGYDLCSDCMVGAVPDGWYVLWCPTCLASVLWTDDVVAEHDGEEDWRETLIWATREAHPQMHSFE